MIVKTICVLDQWPTHVLVSLKVPLPLGHCTILVYWTRCGYLLNDVGGSSTLEFLFQIHFLDMILKVGALLKLKVKCGRVHVELCNLDHLLI